MFNRLGSVKTAAFTGRDSIIYNDGADEMSVKIIKNRKINYD